ncbi:thermonuclease family protein [Granulosicoccus sp. 3-233]
MGVLLTLSPAMAQALPPDPCLHEAESHPVRIAGITDGDSLTLDSGEQLRLIGINTLELHAVDEPERRLARMARDALQALALDRQVLMTPGLESRDSHGRLLAHISLPDGRDAAHALVAEGLALAVAVGANTRCAGSLLTQEQRARKRRLGVWASPGSWFVEDRLSGRETGFHVVAGQVLNISGRGSRTTLHLSNGLHVVLGRHWQDHDGEHTVAPDTLTGSKVQVRGWLSADDGRQRMTLHDPRNLELINN